MYDLDTAFSTRLSHDWFERVLAESNFQSFLFVSKHWMIYMNKKMENFKHTSLFREPTRTTALLGLFSICVSFSSAFELLIELIFFTEIDKEKNTTSF